MHPDVCIYITMKTEFVEYDLACSTSNSHCSFLSIPSNNPMLCPTLHVKQCLKETYSTYLNLVTFQINLLTSSSHWNGICMVITSQLREVPFLLLTFYGSSVSGWLNNPYERFRISVLCHTANFFECQTKNLNLP